MAQGLRRSSPHFLSGCGCLSMAAASDPLEVDATLMKPPALEAPDDSHLPRSASSAMPDLTSESVPRLKAKVHQQLSADDLLHLSLDSLEYRALQPEDFDEMVALHTEWFPVAYDDNFYNKSVSGELLTLAAIHNHSNGNSGGSREGPAPNTSSRSGLLGASSSCESGKRHGMGYDVLGIITLSTSSEHIHSDDFAAVLGADYTSTCESTQHGKDIFDADSNCGALAYILTLGVVDGFRQRGLAKELLRRSIQHVESQLPEVQAVYLHVVTYNKAAIMLYESMNFTRLEEYNNFYNLHGRPYGSILYAHYLHSFSPDWKMRLKSFFSFLRF